tara:strand:+ start:1403 stop:1714 length:312 start_codon:yes stop_codon:yes gene_type:complete
MGDRVSISFKNADEESVALFSHWGGMGFVEEARGYVEDLKIAQPQSILGHGPLARREPNTVMVDFIRYLTSAMPRVEGNYYLGKDETEGDNSNNGHHIIELGN